MFFMGKKKKEDKPLKKKTARGRRPAARPAPRPAPKNKFKTAMNTSSSDSRLYFGALGGVGEIGCNLYLYGTRGQWMIVDLGTGFPDDDTAGAEQLIPDISFLRGVRDRLLGILITHTHYDHFAAIPYYWEELKCPIYGTPFSLKMLERQMAEAGLGGRADYREVSKDGARFGVGPFDVEYIHTTHSIPQASFVVLRTEQGAVLHTGDFDLDPTPRIDAPTDLKKLEELGRGGVLAVMCDSTNAAIGRDGRSEQDAFEELSEVVPRIKSGKIVMTCFSSNIVRVATVYEIARKLGKKLAVFGRSIESNIGIAKTEGYLKDMEYLGAEEAARMDDGDVLYLVTGTQGEKRSVLTRIADGAYPGLRLKEGDNVIFSSLIIPGNEKSIYEVHNKLARRGVNVISILSDPFIHASGHATRPEIEQLYRAVKPRFVVPVHGEPLHLMANKNIAEAMGIEAATIENGEFMAFEGGVAPKVVELVPTGKFAIDGSRQISEASELFSARRKINYNGAVFVSLVMKKGSLLSRPEVSGIGSFEADGADIVRSAIAKEVAADLSRLSKKELADDAKVRDTAVAATKRVIRDRMDKKPPVSVHLARV